MLRKSFAIGTFAAAFAVAGAAGAADMPAPDYTPPPVATPAPMFYDWTGVYAGITAGYAWGDYGLGVTPGTGPLVGGPLASRGFSGDGFLLGGTLGANWQVNNWVFGLEGDLSWADMDGSTTFAAPAYTVSADNRWFGTLRGRVGVALDQVLIYGTGGAAFTSIKATDSLGFSDSNTHTGWTLGGGLELALTDNLSAKAEYLYADFGSKRYTLGDGPVGMDYDAHIIRAGLNYRFSW
jgi:outer membrane immunogenic protein